MNLTGSKLPVEIGKLINLQGLHLSNNKLTGSLPVEIGKLINLQGFYIYLLNKLTCSYTSRDRKTY